MGCYQTEIIMLQTIKKHIHINLCRIMRPIFCRRRPKYDKQYDLCICGIFKDEAPFLKEWITYHKIIGIQHFYLYNNNSTDNYSEVLKEFIDEGSVTLIEWPYAQGQISAYRHFYDNYRHETQWVTFLDIDEFYCPKKDRTLLEWVKRHDKAPVLLVYWKMFGSGGILEHDNDRCVVEQYTISWPTLYQCGKCIVNTDYDIANFDASLHHCTKTVINRRLPFPMLPIDQFGKYSNGDEGLIDKRRSEKADIQINHYWSKGWDIYNKKRLRTGDVFFQKNPKNNISYFLNHEINNTSSDHSIFRFILPLKWRMNGWEFE